jgi:hypothetical protein
MNLYVLIFDRIKGSVEIREFSDPEDAVVHLLEEERRRAYAPELEVVLLNAADEEDLRRTHARYFESINELLEPA